MNEIPNLNRRRRSVVLRAFAWFFSPRILRRVLLGVAGLVTLLAILYVRVNWHGRQEWENCQREMASRGEVWDWSVYAPAPVPDEQNLFKAPKMAEWFGDNRGIFSAPLEHRITNSFARRYANPDTTTEIQSATEAASYLAWSDQFQGDFDTLTAALKRPAARLVADDSRPYSITLPNVASLSAVVKTLVQRAKCHLVLGQPERAWQELSLLHDLRHMVDGQGKFITTESDWMSRELARHSLQVIAKALERHSWQEPQLAALQERLKPLDFVALHADALKCTRALLIGSMEDGEFAKAMFLASGNSFWNRLTRHPEWLLARLAPRGAWYERAASISQNFRQMINALTPADGILHPGEVSRAFASWKGAQQGLPAVLWMQTQVNEGQIACALERYRLAQGSYPETLDTLVPRFIEKLPHDLVNGAPLHYRRREDGTFLLYSVGWNETDDGGKSESDLGDLKQVTLGDWVWNNCVKPEQR